MENKRIRYRGIGIICREDDPQLDDYWYANFGKHKLFSYKSQADIEEQINVILDEEEISCESLNDTQKRWLYTGLLIGFFSGMFVMYQII
jgi:hypothetical protein